MTGRPNIVWISTHDINPHLGCYAGVYPGAEQARTPNLDALADGGMRFDRAFAAAPICGPSRSAIMTGCFPTAIGTMHMRTKAVMPPQVRFVTEYLREAGYYATNNWFTDFQTSTPPSAFDDCSPSAHWRNRPDGVPFFAAFHSLVTHESRLYGDDEQFEARIPHVGPEDRHHPDDVVLPPYHPDTPAFRTTWARYLDLITEMDHWVGGLLDELESDGLAGSTLVVFWSDHGAGMPRAKRWLHDSGLHEPLIMRWPGHLAPGAVHGDPVHLMDLAPTMLQVCGAGVPPSMHGVPLLGPDGSLVDRPNDYVFAGRDRMMEIEDHSRSARDDRHRYVRHTHPGRPPMPHSEYPDALGTWAELRRLARDESAQRTQGEPRTLLTPAQRALVGPEKPAEELYDLDADPHELRNLAGLPEYEAILARFRAAVDGWLARHGDAAGQDEDDLLAAWRPAGEWEVVAVPVPGPDRVPVSPTPGACVVWTDEPPAPQATGRGAGDDVGLPPQDGRHWRIHCAATPPPTGRRVWVKACRPGFVDSAEVATG
ncbi:sulfatase [Pseudonocardia sp. EC080610-09]|uniref:sulfatase family protein n=1 Tax=unclassified Pseudonocardia TaxID=2619320 RepID=UPI0006CB027E|nr:MULTISPECIES: sulfatase [unclassified Pseudonocardia]ALE73562.1 sulfatase [Pseudonocardia sp. EC080625-04]ALL76907.1 sulfatase [Pseudonocardia sp. EC080610-09]ALL83938.1 sulfatase [Pseudonocardia sp. EC080619-01]